jgi:Ser/Thr protein kinase RdoA (MazF antagonist)
MRFNPIQVCFARVVQLNKAQAAKSTQHFSDHAEKHNISVPAPNLKDKDQKTFHVVNMQIER